MAARARLGFVAAAVLAVHIAALDRFALELDRASVLKPTSQPMFTRMLRPEVPPPPPPPPRKAAAKPRPRPTEEAAMAATLPEPIPEASVPQAVTPTVVAEAAPAPVPQPAALPEPAGMGAASPASAASDAAAANPSLDTWPTDTRLSYRLGGMYRGELHGDARVQWQRDAGSYQVRLDIAIHPFITMVMTSQGEVTPTGLAPRAYEEERRGKRRGARFGERAVQLENGKSAPKPAGVQDTASQFVELAHRFATGADVLEVGRSVTFWMARPGAVDEWTYDIVERVMLDTPQLGRIEAFHLKPRPIANPRGNVTAEMWFAPSLQYLPVRIKVNMGDEAYVDLVVETIEQR